MSQINDKQAACCLQNPAYRSAINLKKVKNPMGKLIDFFKVDIWKITELEISRTKLMIYNLIQIVSIAIRGFIKDKLPIRASALTYSIMFSAIPMLALFIAIGKGFGMEESIKEWIISTFIAQKEIIPTMLEFVDRYLDTTHEGVFIGIGLIILLVSVMNFFINLENAFNTIWQVKKPRAFFMQISTYFAAIFLMPVLIVLSGGLKLFFDSILSDMHSIHLISPLLKFGMKITPFVISWSVFTIMYVLIPNTKVKLKNAIVAGIIAGTVFQFFQNIYISGQINLSRYNVIYGSFAAIPLLLLWLQISATIVLIGAEISYASQNFKNYEYESDTKNISTRYKNFVALFITYLIVKRFEKGEKPYQSDELSTEFKLPIRLVNIILTELTECRIISEIRSEDLKIRSYQPAVDINQLSVSQLFDTLNTSGTELFLSKKNDLLDNFWRKTKDLRKNETEVNSDILVKNI